MGKNSKRPCVIDLYAGVGGMSLGAARAGFDLRAAVELDVRAINTHAINFPNTQHFHWDIARTDGESLLEAVGLVHGQLDGLIGGPPCQGFSDIGRRASDDPRNNLFCDFFRLVDEMRPHFFVAENVPGIFARRNQKIVNQALTRIPPCYIVFKATELAANSFGAPTTRSRVFFIGYDPDKTDFPTESKLFKQGFTKATTVGKALAGLPLVRSNWQREDQGWRKIAPLPEREPFYDKLINGVPRGVGSPYALARLRDAQEISGNLGTRHTIE
ncbi:MAG: DNA cytosine methyltransferase, partial [Pyrinomonadaceae bacterium]